MIKGITLPLLRNSEFIQYIKDFLSITLKNDPAALKVKGEYDNLLLQSAALEALYVKEQGSALTESIAMLDARRDRAMLGIAGVVNGFTYHFDAETAQHAENLARQIGQYGGSITKENYQAETAIIDNLLSDFTNKPELEAAIGALQLKAWRDELSTANKAFNETYLQRTQQLGATDPATMLTKRVEVNTAYYELRDFINSYFTINKGAEPYKKAAAGLNALVDQYNTMMAGRLAGDKEEPVVPPTT
jgi:hypothetical protein